MYAILRRIARNRKQILAALVQVRQSLAQIRQATLDGFFSFDSVADTFTHCFAAPVRDAQGVSIATLCIVAPRADASKNYHDYRRVLINSANSLARRINE